MPLIELDPPKTLPRGQDTLRPAALGIGLGLVAPVDRRVGEGLTKAERDMDPAIGVVAAGFEQQHFYRRVFRQPRRDRAAGGAGTDDDEIGLYRV